MQRVRDLLAFTFIVATFSTHASADEPKTGAPAPTIPGARIVPCTHVGASELDHVRCPNGHVGRHLLTLPGAQVRMIDERHAQIVEPCGLGLGRPDPEPYILWYVAGAPVGDYATTPCPAGATWPK